MKTRKNPTTSKHDLEDIELFLLNASLFMTPFFKRLMHFLDKITYSSSFRTWTPRWSSCPHRTLHVENLKISYRINRNVTRTVVTTFLMICNSPWEFLK